MADTERNGAGRDGAGHDAAESTEVVTATSTALSSTSVLRAGDADVGQSRETSDAAGCAAWRSGSGSRRPTCGTGS